jgi:hypothetical protein
MRSQPERKPRKSVNPKRLQQIPISKAKTVKLVPTKDFKALSPLLIETKPEGLAPNEERLAAALSAVINVANVDGTEALRVMRKVSEKIALPKITADQAFERVRLRAVGANEELRDAEGGGLSDAQFAARMGLGSRETIRQYRQKGRIFAWLRDARSYRYPAWQIHRKQLLPGLGEVLAVLKMEKELQPLSIMGYFLTPSDGLDDARPLELLREGKVKEVVADAKRYGDAAIV